MMRCAIVGSGLAALATHATLRHAGVAPEEIAVFGSVLEGSAVERRAAIACRARGMTRLACLVENHPTGSDGLGGRTQRIAQIRLLLGDQE